MLWSKMFLNQTNIFHFLPPKEMLSFIREMHFLGFDILDRKMLLFDSSVFYMTLHTLLKSEPIFFLNHILET